MKARTLPVKNVSRLKAAGDALISRPLGLPGMGLIWGPTGYGKTTAAAWFIAQIHGVYVRAMRLWSPKGLLNAIARELDLDTKGMNNGEMVETIIQRLAETGRPLFIDEADYIVESRRLTDTLRDIHDMSTCPVILIGMHGIERRIRNNEQFTGRIAQWVPFEGADMEDARMLADGLCEVAVEDGLLERLHQDATPKNGNGAEVRRLVVGLTNIEGYARRRGIDSMRLDDWPKGASFFLGTPVSVANGGKVRSLRRGG
jgi:DNA transposition AAA+ family ATPase